MRQERPRHDFRRALLRDQRGASLTEYALILFVVAVVCAIGFKALGHSLGSGMNAAGGHLQNQNQSQPAPQGSEAANAAPAPAGGGDTSTFGGARAAASKEKEGPSSLSKFAMIALGIIGAGAAFFAAMKGKHAR
jgi:Flp pilus assembly pilin Flp